MYDNKKIEITEEFNIKKLDFPTKCCTCIKIRY
jgi:hypothetical protein